MATHSSILAWRIPWTEEPGGPQSMGSQRVGHDLAAEHAPTIEHVLSQGCFHNISGDIVKEIFGAEIQHR